jgi:lipase maturation factor
MGTALGKIKSSEILIMRGQYWLTRFLFLSLLGSIYFVAFWVAAQQYVPLLGSQGIFPIPHYLAMAAQAYGPGLSAYWHLPTLFWFNASDRFIQGIIYLGLGLSVLVMFGLADSLILFILWVLYLSLIHGGQLFYGYGWETMVVEAGFLAMFLPPILSVHPFPQKTPPSLVVIWLIRWMLFRVMFGAALIKFRGDPCWRDLTCLDYHFETQPVPNPLSWYFHHLPHWVLRGGVLFNHLAEIVAPWMILGPRRIRHMGALIMIAFQITLILSGNLSWLNYLTIVLCVACFDDAALRIFFPKKFKEILIYLTAHAQVSVSRQAVSYALAFLVAVLSINPVLNLISRNQAMNTSYDPFFLVNTYGAFGSITKTRNEIILEGTSDETIGPDTQWKEYEFKCKPGDVMRRPCIISPFHYRLDWQMWFAAMEDYRENPWLVRLIGKMLEGDGAILKLFGKNPFPDHPPKYIRATLYEYHFTDWHDLSHAWWRREKLGPYLPPLKREGDRLVPILDPAAINIDKELHGLGSGSG